MCPDPIGVIIPERCSVDDDRIPAILSLIQGAFAYMDDRIDPPSSMKKLTLKDIGKQCTTGEVWIVGSPLQACVFLRNNCGRMYLGKLAVQDHSRRQGLARRLVQLAEERAHSKGLQELELEVRIELVENHRAFEAFGFKKISEGAHEGYDRPTFITMRKAVG